MVTATGTTSTTTAEVESYCNLDFDNITAPIDPYVLKELLLETNYDIDEIDFLVKGFTEGFCIGYKGLRERQDVSSNIPLKVGV